jgi:epoxyqueuosine reductase
VFACLTVRAPVASGIAKWLYRHSSQSVCPFNIKFAQELMEPAFAPRDFLAGKDARTLARDVLAMSPDQFPAAFKKSPMKRAKLRGLKRNAAVVLGNVGSEDDVPVLASALLDAEPLVRAHAAWALGRISSASAAAALQDRVEVEEDAAVRAELFAAVGASASLAR